jgi:phosphoglycerate dehydrogenase-like enzyme
VTVRPRVLVLAGEALFRSFFDDARRRRLSRSFSWRRLSDHRMTPRLRKALAGADGLVTTWDSPVFGPELLDVASRLRVVGHCGGEVKGRFARDLFTRLTITNAPDPMAEPVAELALAFTLAAVRRLDEHRESLRQPSSRVYTRIHRYGLDGETLRGRTVGLVGFGRIGQAVARLLRPFGARLLVHDPYAKAAHVDRYEGTRTSFARLLRASDVLVLAAALTDATRGLLDRRRLSLLRTGATVVNVARGGLVDLDALTREVRRGRLRCALDVTDPQEPLPLRHPLRRLPGALVTPHVGAAGRDVRLQMADIVLDDLERFFRGQRPRRGVTVTQLDRMT